MSAQQQREFAFGDFYVGHAACPLEATERSEPITVAETYDEICRREPGIDGNEGTISEEHAAMAWKKAIEDVRERADVATDDLDHADWLHEQADEAEAVAEELGWT